MPDSPAPSLVVGTAGHIDHGKTALVRALTGHDLDRLPEEKARGITIELGFAALELPSGARLAVVDVPGHERFVRTMVAGASGLDLVMLVVAADEGVMPQTREHLAICSLLGVERGLVVLSKCDLVDAEMRALAEDEVRTLLAGGPLSNAPIVAASAVTGEGVELVRAALEQLVRERPTRGEDARPARLYVDRVFEKHGFGAIATGTWSGRACRVGSAVVLEPGGRKARIRALERHGEAIAAAESGARIAVNLQGLALEQIHRGDLVCEADSLLPTLLFDAEIDWIAGDEMLALPTSVELLTGTCERRARIAPIGEAPIGPGTRGFARIHVEDRPLHLLPGDRFVLRGFARDAGVGGTVGGGRVLDVDPPHRRRRDERLVLDLERLARGSANEGLLVRVERAGLAGTTRTRLARETGRDIAALEQSLSQLADGGDIIRLGPDHCLSSAAAARLSAALRGALEEFHAKAPLQPGMPRATLQGRLPENVPSQVASGLVARLAESGWLTIDEQLVRRSDFCSQLDAGQERLAQALLRRLREAGLEPPSLRTLSEELAVDTSRLRAIAHHLERQGQLVAAPEELFFERASVQQLIERVVDHFERSLELDTQTLKNLIGASRRTAMPLMALLDAMQITRRDGGIRRLLHRDQRS